jgi:hypothetical protein
MPEEHQWLRPNERGLPSVWREGFAAMREHELPKIWMHEHPGQGLPEFEKWRASYPRAFEVWAGPHTEDIVKAREVVLADRLRAIDVFKAEIPAAPDFKQPANESLFRELLRAEMTPDAGTQSMMAEAHSFAADLSRFAEHLTDVTGKALIDTYVQNNAPANADPWLTRLEAEQAFATDPIKDKFDALRDTLKRWNELIGGADRPKAADLEALAQKCRDAIEACRSAVPKYGLDHLHRVQAAEVVTPAGLDAIAC